MAFWLGLSGSLMGLILGAIKIYEFIAQKRAAISATPYLTGDPMMGNSIVLLNASTVPAHVHYFDLAYTEPRRVGGIAISWTRKVVRSESPLEGWEQYLFTIAPHGTHKLDFTEGDYFAWGTKVKEDIYLRLWMLGRPKPIWRLID